MRVRTFLGLITIAMTQAAAKHLDGNTPSPPSSEAPLDQRVDELLSEAERTTLVATGEFESLSNNESTDTEASPESTLDESIDSALDEARQRLDQVAAAATDVQSLDDVLSSSATERLEIAETDADRSGTTGLASINDAPAADPAPVNAAAESVDRISAPAEAEPEISQAVPELAYARRSPVIINTLTWPMTLFPPIARDVIGWFGLVTLFNAACLWLYVLLS